MQTLMPRCIGLENRIGFIACRASCCCLNCPSKCSVAIKFIFPPSTHITLVSNPQVHGTTQHPPMVEHCCPGAQSLSYRGESNCKANIVLRGGCDHVASSVPNLHLHSPTQCSTGIGLAFYSAVEFSHNQLPRVAAARVHNNYSHRSSIVQGYVSGVQEQQIYI